MEITVETVERVAALAMLELTQEHKEELARDMTRIVDYFDLLDKVDTEGVQPLTHLIDSFELRPDEPASPLPQAEALLNSPIRSKDYFKVPKVIERE